MVSKLSQKNNTNIDEEYQVAFNKISKLKEALAPDIMLKFYAYNKQANFGNKSIVRSGSDVRSAFKFNAWVQLKGMSSEKAKKEYIKLAKSISTTN